MGLHRWRAILIAVGKFVLGFAASAIVISLAYLVLTHLY